MNKLSNGMILFGYSQGLICAIVMWITFFYAYFSNGMYWGVKINDYGEAHVELILIVFIQMPLIFFGLLFLFRQYDQRKKYMKQKNKKEVEI